MSSSELTTNGGVLLRIALALLPVLLFLLSLIILDTFKLVRRHRLVGALLAGAGAGLVSYIINSILINQLGWSLITYATTISPLIEEAAKGIYLVWLLRTQRAGFLIDAAILGFGAGSGFAIVENLYYLQNLSDAPLFVWVIRGFGTAIMHGGATSLFAIVVWGLSPSGSAGALRAWLPGLLVAALVHAGFNRFLTHPVLATALVLVVLPIIMRVAYFIGERRFRRWLGRGFDRDTELLALIRDGDVRDTPLGRYLESLRDTFRPETVADLLCLLRLQAELSIRAKGILLLREHGLRAAEDPELAAKLAEVRWLENAVGRTGLLALRPVCRWQGADRWQRRFLHDETGPVR